MTDIGPDGSMTEGQTSEPDAPEAPEPTEASDSFFVVMDQDPQTYHWPGREDCFIVAKDPGMDEAKVERATNRVEVRSDPAAPGGGVAYPASSPTEVWLAKCLAQITDFAIPASDKRDGKTVKTVARYAHQQGGGNDHNKRVYLAIGKCPLGGEIEDFLDRVAGRAGAVGEDFEALGNAPTP
jgi:hypothetical protein